MIRLRFISDDTAAGKIIRYDTRCDWNHVEALLTEGAVTDSSIFVGALPDGGVARRTYADKCYAKVTKQEIATLSTRQDQDAKFWEFLNSQLGKPYDWKAILAFGFGDRDWQEEDSWFCSELIARAAQLAGVFNLPSALPVSRITPRDVWMLASASA